MNLGIITYLAEDKSHGYLLKLDRLEEKYVYDVIKRSSKDNSLKFELRGDDLGLQRFQIVNFKENGKSKKSGKVFAKIESTFFRAIADNENSKFKIIILEFDKEIYILGSSDKQFAGAETNVVMFQLHANIGRYSADFKFDNIITQFEGKGVTGFWLDKFVKLSVSYNEKLASFFDNIFESIIKFLQLQLQESFDLNKLLAKAVLKIKDSSPKHQYNSLTYFISCWQEKYPSFFEYSVLSKILNLTIQLKIELWVLELYTFEELFTEKDPITNEVIEYAIAQEADWQNDFLLKLKSISA